MKRLIVMIMAFALAIGSKAQETKTDSLSLDNNGMIDSIFQSLPEVMVKGERPVVKAEAGKLVYDLPRMIEEKPVENIYDALKELPGVTEMNESITLSGQGVTIVLDGKITTMSNAQLMALLKSMPASRIKNAEVMYNAPARYQVRGAMINITLNHEKNEEGNVQGELFGQYTHESKNAYLERASLLINKGKNPLFSVQERVKMLQIVTKDIPNIRVESFDGLLVDFLKLKDAEFVIRGLRAITDFEYELQMAQTNRIMSPDTDTIFLTTNLKYAYLNSTTVKEVASYGGDISKFVPEFVAKAVMAKYSNR